MDGGGAEGKGDVRASTGGMHTLATSNEMNMKMGGGGGESTRHEITIKRA